MTTAPERPDGHPLGGRPTEAPTEALRASVVSSLANGLFRLQLTDGREVVAHAALELRKAFTRLLPGDPVLVELSPFDPGRARICRLIKSPHHSEQPTATDRPIPPTNLLNGELS
jgi:translation initiation factor IF-1